MKEKLCPMCKRKYTGYSAISRKNNKTEICSSCGTIEAFLIWKENSKEQS